MRKLCPSIIKAVNGELQIRPMERPVYNPTKPTENIPPKVIKLAKIKTAQLSLMEKRGKYKVEKKK